MKIATKRIEINNYWLGRFWRLEEDYPTCFVCGTDKKLERCHLIPRALGGSDNIDNLVLLCQVHHKQAPNLSISKDAPTGAQIKVKAVFGDVESN